MRPHVNMSTSCWHVDISPCLWLQLVTEVPVGIWIWDRFKLKIDRSVKTPWQEYGIVAGSLWLAPDRRYLKINFMSRSRIRRNRRVLKLIPRRSKKNFSHTHETGSWYLLAVFFKISDEQPRDFYMWVAPPSPPPRGKQYFCDLFVQTLVLRVVFCFSSRPFSTDLHRFPHRKWLHWRHTR